MTGLTVYRDLDQGTPEWLAARCGVLTASVIGQLITPTGRVADNDRSRAITVSLASERITGRVDDIHMTPDMWRGVEEEPLARELYAQHHSPVEQVGFMLRDFGGFSIGYSPDGLVGADGLIEIKSRAQKAQVVTVTTGSVPAQNMAQLQTGLLVSGRQWIDYVSYSSGMALFVLRVTPSMKWFDTIRRAAEQFEQQASQIVAQYREAVAGLPVADITPDYTEMVI